MIDFVDANEQIINEKIFTVTQEGTTGQLSINQQVDSTTAGEYEIRYRIYLEQYPSVPALIGQPFTVEIQKLVANSDYTFDLAPDWLQKLQDKYVVIGNNLIYSFGKTQTWTGQDISVQINLGEIESFARFYPERNQIVVTGEKMRAETDIGIHQIEVKVSYNNPTGQLQSERKVFYLHVLAKTQLKIKEVRGEEIDDLASFKGDFDGFIMTKPQEKNNERPIPYIVDFSPTGVLTIAWDRKMKPLEDPDQIPPAKVAVQSYIMEQIENLPRRLEAQSDQVRYLLLDALEVQMCKDKDCDELAEVQAFNWDVISQDDETILLQVNFEDPDDISFSSRDFIVITFYGVEFFKSFKGIDVEFGMQLAQSIQRQMSKSTQTETESIYSASFMFSSVTIMFVLFLIGIGGGILPTWMFLNTMSLIVHTPLLITDMPANLHDFLQKYLDIMRLDLNLIKERGLEIENLRGYSYGYWNNTVLVSSIGISFLTITAFFYLCCRKSKNSSNRAAWMTNFTLRYAYVVFFEVFLCLVIQVTADDLDGQGAWWLSLILLVVLSLGVGLLLVLMCMAGQKTQQPVSAQTTSQNEHHDEENTARDGTSSNLIPLTRQQAVEEYEGGQRQLPVGIQEEIKKQARLNVTNTIKMNLAYQTLFLGLQKNHCYHCLTFIARRVLFVVAVVFMTQYSLLGILQLMITCLIMSALAQWQDSLITLQHLVNEAFFYFLLCCGLVPGGLRSSQEGHILVLSTTALISFNMIIIIYDLARHLRLLFRRYSWRYSYVKQPTPSQKKPISIKKQSSSVQVQHSQMMHQTIELDPEIELSQVIVIDELDQNIIQDQNVGCQRKARPESDKANLEPPLIVVQPENQECTGSELSEAMMDVPDEMIDVPEENRNQLGRELQSNQQRSEILEIDKLQLQSTPQNVRMEAQESAAINLTIPRTTSANRNLLTLQQSCGRPPTFKSDSLSQNEQLSPFRPRRYMEDNQDEKRRTQLFPRLMTASHRNEHLTAVARLSNMNFGTVRSQPSNVTNSQVETQKALLPGAVAKENSFCQEIGSSIDQQKQDSKCYYKDDSSHQQRNSSSQSKLAPHELIKKTVRVASDKFDCEQKTQVCQGADDEDDGQALDLHDKMAVSEGKRVSELPDLLPDSISYAGMTVKEDITEKYQKAEYNIEKNLAQNEQDNYKTVKDTLAQDQNDSDLLEKDSAARVCDQQVRICEAISEISVKQAGAQDGQVIDLPVEQVTTDDKNVSEKALVKVKEGSEISKQKATGEQEKVSYLPEQQATQVDGSVLDELTKHATEGNNQILNQPIKEAAAEDEKVSDLPILQAATEDENLMDQPDQKALAQDDQVSHQHVNQVTSDDEQKLELTFVKVLASEKQDSEFPVIQAAAEDEKASNVPFKECTPQDESIFAVPINQAATKVSQVSILPFCESFEENKDVNDFHQIQDDVIERKVYAQPDKKAVAKCAQVSDQPNKHTNTENQQFISQPSLKAPTEDKQAFPAIQAVEGENQISNLIDKKILDAEDVLISNLHINKTVTAYDKAKDKNIATEHKQATYLPGNKVSDLPDKQADNAGIQFAEIIRKALAQERRFTDLDQRNNSNQIRAIPQNQQYTVLPTKKAVVKKLDLQFYPYHKVSNPDARHSMGQKKTCDKLVGILRGSTEQQRLTGDSIPKIEANEDQARLQRQLSGSSLPIITKQRSFSSFSEQKSKTKVPERRMQVTNLSQVRPIRNFTSFGDEYGDDQQESPSKLSTSRLPLRTHSIASSINEGSLGSRETPLEQIDENSDFKLTAAVNYQLLAKNKNILQKPKTQRNNKIETKIFKRSKTYQNLTIKKNSTSMDLTPYLEQPEIINQRAQSKWLDDDMQMQNYFVIKTSRQSVSNNISGPIAPPPYRRIEFFKGQAQTSLSMQESIGSMNNESRYHHEYGKYDDNTRRSGHRHLKHQQTGKLVLRKPFSLPRLQTPDLLQSNQTQLLSSTVEPFEKRMSTIRPQKRHFKE